MPFHIYRYAPNGERVDRLRSYASFSEIEQAYLEHLVGSPEFDSTLFARMRDPYADCVLAHSELSRLIDDLRHLHDRTIPEPLRAALVKIEDAASAALAEGSNLVLEGD